MSARKKTRKTKKTPPRAATKNAPRSALDALIKESAATAPSDPAKNTRAKKSVLERFGLVKKRSPAEKARLAEAEHQRKLIEKDVKHPDKKKLSAAEKKEQDAKSLEAQQRLEDSELLKKQQKAARKRRSLKVLFKLAGVEEEPATLYKRLLGVAFWGTLALTVIAVVMGSVYGEAFKDPVSVKQFLGFLLALWTVGYAGLYCVLLIISLVWVDMRMEKRRREIEAVFPDYLQLAAANLSAGMTIDRALWSAVRPRFGVLAKEMEDVAKKTMTGYDLEQSLKEFSEKYDSIVIKRAIDLIVEGSRSGGRMADILTKIALNIQENAILQKEMAANVTTYVIFISFASVLASPFLFGLSTQLLVVIQAIAGSIAVDSGSSSGVGLALSADAVKLSDFKIFSYVTLTITAFMSAFIVSVIRKGGISDGLRLAPGYWAATMLIYIFATWALGFLFTGLVSFG
jgi:Flp pilus assembly protein TadB